MASSLKTPPSRLVVMTSTAEKYGTSSSAVQVLRAERFRQQLTQERRIDSFAGVDQQIIATVLEEHLSTSSARGDGPSVARNDGDGAKTPPALSHEIAHQRTLSHRVSP